MSEQSQCAEAFGHEDAKDLLQELEQAAAVMSHDDIDRTDAIWLSNAEERRACLSVLTMPFAELREAAQNSPDFAMALVRVVDHARHGVYEMLRDAMDEALTRAVAALSHRDDMDEIAKEARRLRSFGMLPPANRVISGKAGTKEPPVGFHGLLPWSVYISNALAGMGNPGNLRMMRACDDSMSPTIKHMESAIVDVSANFLCGDGLYAIWHAGGVAIRRLFYRNGRTLVCKDNGDWPGSDWHMDEDDEVAIVGKVVGCWTIGIKSEVGPVTKQEGGEA